MMIPCSSDATGMPSGTSAIFQIIIAINPPAIASANNHRIRSNPSIQLMLFALRLKVMPPDSTAPLIQFAPGIPPVEVPVMGWRALAVYPTGRLHWRKSALSGAGCLPALDGCGKWLRSELWTEALSMDTGLLTLIWPQWMCDCV